MKLSLVLWNCDGKRGVGSGGEERNAVFKSTYDSWKQENRIPTVVLAQELYLVGLTRTWEELSKKSNSFHICEAACFFLKGLGQEIKFLDSGDLQSIMDDNLESDDDGYHDRIARIHCAIVTIGAEKILICSWHGQHNEFDDDDKKVLLEKMLIFVDKVKEDQGCVAALVGGDFNLDKKKAKQSISVESKSVESARLYYTREASRPRSSNIIDYVIAWPKNRFKKRECYKIKTHSPEEDNANPRMFDHALIRYDFIVNLKGEWEGEGEVKWGGGCGEGKVTLRRYCSDENFDVKVTGVESGKWKGHGKGSCKTFEKLEIKGGKSFIVNYGGEGHAVAIGATLTLTSEICEEMNWKGNGQVEWEGADAEVNCECSGRRNGEQTVTWKGTGPVEWRGKGKATWVGGKLEKWEGIQTVRCADDRKVQWNGDGEVELQGDELKHNAQGTLTLHQFGVERVHYNLEESSKLAWSGRGVVWKVTGSGEGKMLDWDTV